uniref:Membrane magnesium transporter n=1 Tax=Timema douglasi TaxID=61478 RepID=A0A7R8Z7E5_TIMDO|nr:unnamed protein product [Timema douglasi]
MTITEQGLRKLFVVGGGGGTQIRGRSPCSLLDRSYLRITEQEFVSLPVDILVQGIISLFLTMYGLMSISGEFKEIRATVDLETKSWETLRNIPSFYVFSHRGRALSPNYVPPLQKAILEEMDS